MKEISLDDLKILVESLDDEDAPLPIVNEDKDEVKSLVVEGAKEAQKNVFRSLLTEIRQNENEIERLKEEQSKNIVESAASKLPEIKEQVQEDPLLKEKVASLSELQAKQNLLIERLQRQLGSLGGGGEVRLEFLDDVDRDSVKVDGKVLSFQASTGKFVGVTNSGGGGGADTETVRDAIQGFHGYTTDFFTVGVANTSQTLDADTFTVILPQVASGGIQSHLPSVMNDANDGDPYITGAGVTIGTGQTEFSLAGLGSGAACLVRTSLAFNPDIDNTNLDVRLVFTTNTDTQGTGLTNFNITKEQALIMNEGADQSYRSEVLFSFFVGDTLEGTTKSDAGSFHIEASSSEEGDLEVAAVTVNVVA